MNFTAFISIIVILVLVIIFTKFTKKAEDRVNKEISELMYDFFEEQDYIKLKKRKNFFRILYYIFLAILWFCIIIICSYLFSKLN